ncbi:MAG TPA: DUF4386 domain-containing protein [Thermoanaerobaculia bacterium]|jgi:hypothetical protein|nr:DUF4386 domain-containing protein [Thermoanaerobaculia bacterium]
MRTTHTAIFYAAGLVPALAAAFVRSRLVIFDDATATAMNIVAHEPLFRLVSAADLLSAGCYVAVTLLLFQIFRPFHKGLSFVATFLGLAGCTVAIAAALFEIAALFVVRGAEHWNILAVKALPALALLFLELQSRSYNVSIACFGLFTLLIAYLTLRTRNTYRLQE